MLLYGMELLAVFTILRSITMPTREEIENCPKCEKEAHLCKCPVIDRGSFSKYTEVEK